MSKKQSGVAIEDVPKWLIVSGVSHAVSMFDGRHVFTACSKFIAGEPSGKKPRRICSGCRKNLKTAFLWKAAK